MKRKWKAVALTAVIALNGCSFLDEENGTLNYANQATEYVNDATEVVNNTVQKKCKEKVSGVAYLFSQWDNRYCLCFTKGWHP